VIEENMHPEIQHYLRMIDDLRSQLIDLLGGLPADALNWRPLPQEDDHATNSLAVLATHVAGAEHFWIAEVIGGHPGTRQRDAEFQARVSSADPLIDKLEKTGRETEEIMSALSLTDLEVDHETRGHLVSARWAILHVIDHTALHLGHMQITYQLWKGGEARDSPRWFRRVPSSK
jgi:uncharacterized damage-inducible protein DinB